MRCLTRVCSRAPPPVVARFGGVAAEVYLPVVNPSDTPLRVTLVPPCEAVVGPQLSAEELLARSPGAELASVRTKKSNTRHTRLLRYLNTTSRQILAAWRGASDAVRDSRVLSLPVGYSQQAWLKKLGESCCCLEEVANLIDSWEVDEAEESARKFAMMQFAAGVVPAPSWSKNSVCNAVGPGTGDGDGHSAIPDGGQSTSCQARQPSFAYGARDGAVLSAMLPAGGCVPPPPPVTAAVPIAAASWPRVLTVTLCHLLPLGTLCWGPSCSGRCRWDRTRRWCGWRTT